MHRTRADDDEKGEDGNDGYDFSHELVVPGKPQRKLAKS